MSGARSSGVICFSVLLAFFYTSCWGILSCDEEACASNGPTRRLRSYQRLALEVKEVVSIKPLKPLAQKDCLRTNTVLRVTTAKKPEPLLRRLLRKQCEGAVFVSQYKAFWVDFFCSKLDYAKRKERLERRLKVMAQDVKKGIFSKNSYFDFSKETYETLHNVTQNINRTWMLLNEEEEQRVGLYRHELMCAKAEAHQVCAFLGGLGEKTVL